MGKKSAQKNSQTSDRLGWINPEQLDSFVKELLEVDGELRGLARAMKDSGVDEVKVDGFTKFRRARRLLNEFRINAESAIEKAKSKKKFG